MHGRIPPGGTSRRSDQNRAADDSGRTLVRNSLKKEMGTGMRIRNRRGVGTTHGFRRDRRAASRRTRRPGISAGRGRQHRTLPDLDDGTFRQTSGNPRRRRNPAAGSRADGDGRLTGPDYSSFRKRPPVHSRSVDRCNSLKPSSVKFEATLSNSVARIPASVR